MKYRTISKQLFKSIWAANLLRVRAMYIQGRGLKIATILSGNRTPCLRTEFNQAVRTPPSNYCEKIYSVHPTSVLNVNWASPFKE